MEQCSHCGKGVLNPVYAPKHEETTTCAPWHKKCLEKIVRAWDRANR